MPDTDRGSQKNTGRNRAGGEKLKDTIENIAKNYEINPTVIFFLTILNLILRRKRIMRTVHLRKMAQKQILILRLEKIMKTARSTHDITH